MDYKGMWERLKKELIVRDNSSEGVIQYAMEFDDESIDLLAEASVISAARMVKKLMADIESEAKDAQCQEE